MTPDPIAFCCGGRDAIPGTCRENGSSPNGFRVARLVLTLTTAGRTRATAPTNGLRVHPVEGAPATCACTGWGPTYPDTIAPVPPLTAATSSTMTATSTFRNRTIRTLPPLIRDACARSQDRS